MNEHILKTVSQGIAAQRQRQKIEQARQMPAMAPPPMPMPGDEAARLQAEADTYLAAMKAPMPAPSLPPIATPRRSLPVAAPVSRDVPTASGQKLSAQQTVTLSAEEREIAHKSYGCMTKARAEQEYALQKAKLNRMRASGIYPERERNSMTPGKSIPPIRYCSDDGVRQFIEHDFAFWHPYLLPDRVMSAEQLFAAARRQFGDMRCWDLTILKH